MNRTVNGEVEGMPVRTQRFVPPPSMNKVAEVQPEIISQRAAVFGGYVLY